MVVMMLMLEVCLQQHATLLDVMNMANVYINHIQDPNCMCGVYQCEQRTESKYWITS